MIRLITALVIMTSVLVGSSSATSWHVEKDGLGDYSVIQDAVDISASGDTVLIGPGRFEEYETLYNNYGNPIAHFYVDLLGKSLTLLGAGTEQTFIGPASLDFHPWPGPDIFIVRANGCPVLVIRNLTLDHSRFSMLNMAMVGSLDVSDCIFKEGQYGILGNVSGSGVISNCLFEDLSSDGVAIFDPSPNVLVEDCIFNNVHGPVSVDWSPARCEVVNCQMDCGRVGVKFAGGGRGGFHIAPSEILTTTVWPFLTEVKSPSPKT